MRKILLPSIFLPLGARGMEIEMKSLAFVISAMVLSVGTANATPVTQHAAPAPAALPIFDFLGQNTETPSSPFALSGSTCSPATTGEADCEAMAVKIGNALTSIITLSFNNGKLYRAKGIAAGVFYQMVLDAFTSKYGQPSATEIRKWQNQAGATFDNPTSIWKFSGGNLELSQMGWRQDSCAFRFFTAKNAPAVTPAPVNF